MPGAGQLAERMQLGGAGAREEAVPGVRADRGDDLQLGVRDPEADRPLERRDVRQEVPHGLFAARVHGQDEEDSRCGERAHDRLRLRCCLMRWHK